MNMLLHQMKRLHIAVRVFKYRLAARGASDLVEGARYNPLKAPRFRVNTFFEDSEDGRIVVKRPDSSVAVEQIDRFVRGRELLSGVYKKIELLDVERHGDELVIPYVEGEQLMADVNLSCCSIDEIVSNLANTMETIFEYNSDVGPFIETEQFRANFPGIHPDPSEEAYPIINLDSNVDNFIRKDDKIVCIDYEWVEDYPIPVRFVKFRLLFNYYLNHPELKSLISKNDFFKGFGFSKADVKMFTTMEECFHLYVVDLGYKGSRF